MATAAAVANCQWGVHCGASPDGGGESMHDAVDSVLGSPRRLAEVCAALRSAFAA